MEMYNINPHNIISSARKFERYCFNTYSDMIRSVSLYIHI